MLPSSRKEPRMGKHRPSADGRPAAELIHRYLHPVTEPDEAPTDVIPKIADYPPRNRLTPWLAGAALAGTLVVGVGSAPPEAAATRPQQLSDVLRDLPPPSEEQMTDRLSELAASRATRDAEKAAAADVQAAAETVAVQAAQEAAEAAEEAARQEEAAAASQAATESVVTAGPASSPPVVTGQARITNSAGPVSPRVQAAADAVIRDVPGAAGITLGGTRGSAVDPGGHPSGNAVDYMVGGNSALGDAIVAYHIANWDALGVDYIIWEQRYLNSPGGTWDLMENRGGATANHMDHPHVNYRP